MMSFWVVPVSRLALDPVLLRHGDVEGEQPRGRGVDRHRGVHLVERDAVEQGVHVALVGDRDADLADLAAGQRVIGVVPGLGGEIEGDGEAGLALGQVSPVELVRAPRVGVPGVGAHHPGPVRLRRADARSCGGILRSEAASRAGARCRRSCSPRLHLRSSMTNLIDLHAPGPRPRDRRLRGGRPDRRSGSLVVPRDPAGGPRGRAARAPPHPHPSRSRRRLGLARRAVPEAAGVRARGRGAASRRSAEAAARAQAGCTATTWSASGARCCPCRPPASSR